MAPMINRVEVLKYFKVLTIDTNIFAFEVRVILVLESTYLDGWIGGWLGWVSWKYSHLSPAKAGTWADLGKNGRVDDRIKY